MRLLVLGGTSFVGRWVVTAPADRGWAVTLPSLGLDTAKERAALAAGRVVKR